LPRKPDSPVLDLRSAFAESTIAGTVSTSGALLLFFMLIRS